MNRRESMCFLDRNQNLKKFRKTDLIYRRKAAPSTVHFVPTRSSPACVCIKSSNRISDIGGSRKKGRQERQGKKKKRDGRKNREEETGKAGKKKKITSSHLVTQLFRSLLERFILFSLSIFLSRILPPSLSHLIKPRIPKISCWSQ